MREPCQYDASEREVREESEHKMGAKFDKLLICLRTLKEQGETLSSVRTKTREELQVEVDLSNTDDTNRIDIVNDNELWEAVLKAFEIMS